MHLDPMTGRGIHDAQATCFAC
ncbi:hypothetical protein CBM2634_B170454 [Cupriavidus taiwanensis]|uniref:Uncharacterized protein n=1 Tax=Cupriavidus taiwanensis TaxID=164546 RepID=A0A375J7P4_9BURK|nr:hypothetical protein CBM2634_B170454 [Cupriavidus taiwanensis]